MMWRMGKIAGAIDTIVRLVETIIQILPSFKFQTAAGKELPVRDLAGLARSIQAATSVRQGAPLYESDVKSLEKRFAVVEADVKAMLAQLASAASDATE
jgi:predicted trehalose synthase